MTDEARLVAILRDSPRVMQALRIARDLNLPDWRLVSGGVYQTVWNSMTGRDPDYGIKDYDLCYFDPDMSWEAEDRFIRRAATTAPPPLDTMIEVRNQARVHLWFEAKFGEPCAPLPNTDAALARFVCTAFAVGVRLEADDGISVAAPFGLEDLFALRLRPNPDRPFRAEAFTRTTGSAHARWPEVTLETK